jgi:8-oxo-dGTP pyrophosphatase MutT (NUDIX family)
MKPGKIRPLAICVFRKQDRIFVAEGYDSVKQETFYRPLGGKIEFGELGRETVKREIREEIDEKVRKLRYLGTLENVFTYNGERGHEIIRVYDGKFSEKSVYKRQVVEGHEGDLIFQVMWKELAYFRAGEAPLYPDGLLELLDGDDS